MAVGCDAQGLVVSETSREGVVSWLGQQPRHARTECDLPDGVEVWLGHERVGHDGHSVREAEEVGGNLLGVGVVAEEGRVAGKRMPCQRTEGGGMNAKRTHMINADMGAWTVGRCEGCPAFI